MNNAIKNQIYTKINHNISLLSDSTKRKSQSHKDSYRHCHLT